MDVLSDVLRSVKLTSVVYFKSDFSAPWGMEVSSGEFAQFHMVIRGHCVLKSDETNIVLNAGDIVVFPLGTAHWLADETSSQRSNGRDVVHAIQSGRPMFRGERVSATLVCGHFELDRGFDHPFIENLPTLIHIRDNEKRELSWLESISNLIIREADQEKPGSDLITSKLGEIFFIHILRAYILQHGKGQGFFAALRDSRIAKALSAIHAQPDKNWTLADLSKVAGISRTGFSTQFKTLVGQTPLNYLTRWRMLMACEHLAISPGSVGEVGDRVGYQSEAAFNRAFKKYIGQTPLKYRQQAQRYHV